ncbi:MAG: GNAT family N-acetyltransferase [Planctomycetota bacterium]
MSTNLVLRDDVRESDEARVRELVRSSGFFTPEEQEIAVELVHERRVRGERESGYSFVFLDDGPTAVAYACFGRIPMTASSYDLYWIVTDDARRGRGLGRRLLREVERRVARAGGGRIYVETSSRAQYDPTRAFYENTGYTRAAYFEGFYREGDGKIVYVKRVPAAP